MKAMRSPIWVCASPSFWPTRERAALHRCAPVLVPGFEQPADLVERAAEALGPGDELEPCDVSVAVHPVAGAGPIRRGEQPDVLVVAKRRSAEAGALGDIGDPHAGVRVHAPTVCLQPDLKVKGIVESVGTRLAGRT